MIVVEPEEYLKNFIRSFVDDITRVGYSNRYTSTSESFNGDTVETDFTMSRSILAFVTVTVDGTLQKIHSDYEINLDTNKVIFNSAPATGTNNIVIAYKYGTNWVFPDKPRDDLTESSYPRVGIIKITETSNPQGVGEDNTYDSVVFQIDVLTSKDLMCTVSTENIEGADVVRYLARTIKNAIKNNWRTNLGTVLFNPIFLRNDPVPFEPDRNMFRHILEVRFNMFNVGE